jgi:hypothetical protein
MESYEQELSHSFETVLREADALYGGTGRLQQTYQRLAARLERLGIAFELVGGFALIRHGVRRFTEDIDMLVRPRDFDALKDDLLGSGYVSIPGSSRSIRDTQTKVRIDFVLSGEFPGDGKPKEIAFPDPGEHDAGSEQVRVVGLRTLIELKLASGMTASNRLQDLADVQRLIEVHRLTAAFTEQLHPYVRPTFLKLCESLRSRPPPP